MSWKRLVGAVVALVATVQAGAMVQADKSHAVSSKTIEAVEGEYVVKFKSGGGLSLKSAFSTFAKMGVQVKETVNDAEDLYLVRVKDTKSFGRMGGISALSSMSTVEYAEPNYIYRILGTPMTKPNDPGFERLWGLENVGQKDSSGREGKVGADIGATKAWTLNTGSKNVIVAVIDTGIDYNHPDLRANIWVKPGTTNVHGFNAINNREDPMDDNSHGTHCAGTIGGVGDNGVGVAGVSWNVSLMGVKFLSASGGGTLADAIKAIDWATNNGAHIMSNSWGGGGFSQALADAIKRATDKGILFVAAAGNDGANNDSRATYPANYPGVFSVAASNNVDGMAGFSNFGVRTVHLMAPGENVYSSIRGGNYASYSGTSMATPHVSGAAALAWAHEPSLTAEEIKERLMRTAEKLRPFRRKLVSAGRLNVYNLLTNTEPPGFVVVPEDTWKPAVAHKIESQHPYPNSVRLRYEVSHPGAKFIRLRFARLETEAGYDIVRIRSAKTGEEVDALSGTVAAGTWTPEVEGDKVIIEFTSDASINGHGFEIDAYSWSEFDGASN